MGDENTRFITVRVLSEDFEKYKAYLQYITKKSIQDDIREYVHSRGELVDGKKMDSFLAHVNEKMRGKGEKNLTTDKIMSLTRGDV